MRIPTGLLPRDLSWRRSSAVAVYAVIVMAAAGCSVLFDVPESTPEVDAAARTSASMFQAEDTTPAPIEAIVNPDSILALLPKHTNGEIDWTTALRTQVVKPRKGAPGRVRPEYLEGFGYDLTLEGPDAMFDARFPHSQHAEWMACQNCHPSRIPPRDVGTTMQQINDGESCGACHGSVAFSRAACGRCHAAMPAGEFEAALYDDIVMARAADGLSAAAEVFPPSRFAHWKHRIRYRCSACHDELFTMQAGTDTLTMPAMQEKQACGACHDGSAAFPLTDCNRCHAQPATPEVNPP